MENSLKNNRLILKSQQRFTSQKHNVFIEEASANNDKIIQSMASIETYAYGISNDQVFKKEEEKCSNIIKHYKNY